CRPGQVAVFSGTDGHGPRPPVRLMQTVAQRLCERTESSGEIERRLQRVGWQFRGTDVPTLRGVVQPSTSSNCRNRSSAWDKIGMPCAKNIRFIVRARSFRNERRIYLSSTSAWGEK